MKRLFPKVLAVLLLVFVFMSAGTVQAKAAQLTRATLRYDRMMTGKLSSLQVVLVPVTVNTEAKVRLIFASATLGAGQSASTAAIPSYSIALPGVGTTAVGAGTSITVPCTDLTVGTTYAFNLTIGVSTPAAGSYLDQIQTLDGSGNVIDSTTVKSVIITNDQVVITANVPSSFTYVLSGNTDAFTTDLSASSVSTTNGITVSVTTNAAKGWVGWIKSQNAQLSSVTTGEYIGTSGTVDGSPTSCVVGSDCYVLDASKTTTGSGGGVLSIDPEYLGVGTSDGGTLSTTFQPFVSRTGKTAGDVITLYARATMIGTKAAGSDYTDTWTVVGAGSF